MRYQQTPTSRLAKAAKYLVSDGTWHPFVDEEGMYYRVRGKMVQRVRIEKGEDDVLLRLFENFEPLPLRVLREGFREELHFVVDDDRYLLTGLLLRIYPGWEALSAAGKPLGIRLVFLGGNSLQYSIEFTDWCSDEITRILLLSKAFARVAAQLVKDAAEDIPHIHTEITGLLRSAHLLMMEQNGVGKTDAAKPRKREEIQGRLFE
jgi:hypothetical protein